jgi:hypothetical protein
MLRQAIVVLILASHVFAQTLYDLPGLLLPGGVIKVNKPGGQICTGNELTAGSTQVGGFINFGEMPALGSFQGLFNGTFQCVSAGVVGNYTLDFETKMQLAILGTDMEYVKADVTYDSSMSDLTAKMQYGAVFVSIDLKLNPIELHSFSLVLQDGASFSDPKAFPFATTFDGASTSQTMADLTNMITNAPVAGGFISYQQPDALQFGVKKLSGLLPGIDISMTANLKLASSLNGTALAQALAGVQLVDAALELTSDDQPSVTVAVKGANGLCAPDSDISASLTLPGKPEWGLRSPLTVSGTLGFYCGSNTTNAGVPTLVRRERSQPLSHQRRYLKRQLEKRGFETRQDNTTVNATEIVAPACP